MQSRKQAPRQLSTSQVEAAIAFSARSVHADRTTLAQSREALQRSRELLDQPVYPLEHRAQEIEVINVSAENEI